MNEKITLKVIRAQHNLTQSEAGNRVGVSGDVWHNWEHGKTYPNILQIQRIEKEFDVSYNQIIFLTKNYG